LGFFVAVMQIMMVELCLLAKFVCMEQDIICYNMEQQHKRCCEQFEEQLQFHTRNDVQSFLSKSVLLLKTTSSHKLLAYVASYKKQSLQ
jgi:hypothetical protein